MDKPIKHLILLASGHDDGQPSDLENVRKLQGKIDPEILAGVTSVIAPFELKGKRIALVDALLGREHQYERTHRPAILHPSYLQRVLTKFSDDQAAILVVVPASQMTGIASALIHRDTRQGASEIRLRATGQIKPGTGILVEHNGAWASFTPESVQITQLSCPLTADCIKAPSEFKTTRRGAVVVLAAGLAALGRRSLQKLDQSL